ncbi:MAG TPA: cyclic nucleotide-binding domain-containing protein [Azospirillaceae bacterium]|nr:cyclic nucleotide-binding domain-containing protein [Azospirillaceae bacterium]
MSSCEFSAGEMILDEGRPGQEAYIVGSGRVQVFRTTPQGRRVLGEAGPGEIFGEMALVDDGPRMASAVALEPTRCRRVGRETFVAAFNKAPPLVRYLLQTQVNSIRNLAGAPFAEANTLGLGARIVSHAELSATLERLILPTGRVILREGEPGDAAYLVQSGVVELRREGPKGKPIVLRRMGPGCVFGEMALVERRPRTATAVVVEPAVCEVVSEPVFRTLVESAPPVIGMLLLAYIRHVHALGGTGGR